MVIKVVSDRADLQVFRFVSLCRPADPEDAPCVSVLFTDINETKAGLRIAATLACDLGFKLQLVIAELVPYPLPLSCPPVPLHFRLSQVVQLVKSSGVVPDVQIYLCRDPVQTLSAFLSPLSPLVIGLSNTWLPTRAKRLARKLQKTGREVILVSPSL